MHYLHRVTTTACAKFHIMEIDHSGFYPMPAPETTHWYVYISEFLYSVVIFSILNLHSFVEDMKFCLLQWLFLIWLYVQRTCQGSNKSNKNMQHTKQLIQTDVVTLTHTIYNVCISSIFHNLLLKLNHLWMVTLLPLYSLRYCNLTL